MPADNAIRRTGDRQRPHFQDVERTARRSVDKLLASVRSNRPADKELLEYLKDYCYAAWRKGYESAKSRYRRAVQ